MPQVRVFVLHPSYERCQQIIEAFEQWEELELLPVADLRRAPERIRQEEPELIVVAVDNVSDPSLKAIETVKRRGEKPAIMVVSREPSQELLLKCIRAGADEFVQFPIQPEEFANALSRLKRKLGLISEQEGKVLGIYGSSGGCGATTIACNLAANVARQLGEANSCSLIDLNLQYGSVALFMDLRQFSHSVADAARDVDRLDAALLQSYMSPHESGAAVLPAPLDAEEVEGVAPQDISGVIEVSRKNYRFSILDIPHAVDEYGIVSLDACDEIFLVSDLMLPAIRNTIRTRDLFEKLDYKKDKLKLIVNRYYESEYVSLQEISEHVQLPVFWLVPYDSPTAIKAVNSGRTIDEVSPGSDIADSFVAMAQHVAGVQVQKKPKKRFSLFSRRS